MATEPFDPEVADQMRQQIRVIVREIEGLSRAEIEPAEFYEGLLNRVVAAMAAEGGAVWVANESGRLELAFQINLRATGLADDQAAQERHGRLLMKIQQTGQPALAAPNSSHEGSEIGNPTPFLLVLAPLKNETEVAGIIEILQRPGNLPNVERGYLRFLTQMAELAGDYLRGQKLRQLTSRQAMWSQLEQFTRLVHRDLEPQETAYTIANEGRRLIECDRVSVATRSGSSYRLKAISGQEGFDRRSNIVTLLEQLITTVCRGGEALWYNGDSANLPPQIEQALEAYVDEAHTKYVAILPLANTKSKHKPTASDADDDPNAPRGEILGALVVEQITEQALAPGMQRRVEVVRDHSALALTNAIEHHSLFLMPVWRLLGKSRAVVALRNLPKTLAVLAILLGGLIALFLWPKEFTLESHGSLEPVVKQEVFAEQTGIVTKIDELQHGNTVRAGQQLAVLTSRELEAEISSTQGEIESLEKVVQSVNNALRVSGVPEIEKARLTGERAKTQAQIQTLLARKKILEDQQQQLVVISPIDGILTTWDVRNKLINRPVERGQKLMTIADPSKDWQLELRMPEDRMGHILSARRQLQAKTPAGAPKPDLRVTFILKTHPDLELTGTIKDIHTIAEVQGEEGNIVLIKVAVDAAKMRELGINDLRPGASVIAKVHCGKTSVGYAWFHDVIAFVQSRILFKFW